MVLSLAKALYLNAMQQIETNADPGRQSRRFTQTCARLSRLQGSLWAVDAGQLLLIRKYEIIDQVPRVSEEELRDQSKGDTLVKGLTMAQSLHLIIQLIVRHLNHQPSSQLEVVVVVAFSICSFITYLALLSKPQDVQTPRYIKAKYYPNDEQILALAHISPQRLWRNGLLGTRSYAVPNLSCHYNETMGRGIDFVGGTILASIVFGSLHCIAWDFSFPTNVENFCGGWLPSSPLSYRYLISCFRSSYLYYLKVVAGAMRRGSPNEARDSCSIPLEGPYYPYCSFY
jgi:hypothetical protein